MSHAQLEIVLQIGGIPLPATVTHCQDHEAPRFQTIDHSVRPVEHLTQIVAIDRFRNPPPPPRVVTKSSHTLEKRRDPTVGGPGTVRRDVLGNLSHSG